MERINYMKQCRWTSKSCWVKEIKRRSVHIVGFCAYEVEKWANVNCAARNQIASCPRVEQDRAFWGYWDRALSKPSELRVMHFLHVNYIPIKQKKKIVGGVLSTFIDGYVCTDISRNHILASYIDQKPNISKGLSWKGDQETRNWKEALFSLHNLIPLEILTTCVQYRKQVIQKIFTTLSKGTPLWPLKSLSPAVLWKYGSAMVC